VDLSDLACSAVYIYMASGKVYVAAGWGRVASTLVLAGAVGAIVVGYRFAIFPVTLYMT
jgi:hypothetical protein